MSLLLKTDYLNKQLNNNIKSLYQSTVDTSSLFTSEGINIQTLVYQLPCVGINGQNEPVQELSGYIELNFPKLPSNRIPDIDVSCYLEPKVYNEEYLDGNIYGSLNWTKQWICENTVDEISDKYLIIYISWAGIYHIDFIEYLPSLLTIQLINRNLMALSGTTYAKK